MSDRICPHCNRPMRPWKPGDYLPDFAEVTASGDPTKKWWVCPDPHPYVCTFYEADPRESS